MDNLSLAKEYLDKGCSVCLLKDDDLVVSSGKGISFIAFLARDGKRFTGYSVADKIVGKAAAYIYTILGVKEVYGAVMIKEGLKILTAHSIQASFGSLVDEIINREGTGICPMEMTVLNVRDAQEALEAVLDKIELLKKGKIEKSQIWRHYENR